MKKHLEAKYNNKILKYAMITIAITGMLLLILLCNFMVSVRPASVSGLRVDAVTYDSVSLSWSKSNNADMYKIYRETGGVSEFAGASDGPSFVDENLATGKKYTYDVRACNNLKQSRSAKISAVTFIETPSLSVDTSHGKIELNASDTDGAEKFKFFRGGEVIGVSTKSNFVDVSAKPDRKYAYTVLAIRDKYETGQSESVNAKLISPGDIKFEIESENVIISWNDDTYNNYELYDGDDLLVSTTEHEYSFPAEKRVYDIKLIGYGKVQSPVESKKFEVVEDTMDNQTAIERSIEWAEKIAADDTYTYGKGYDGYFTCCVCAGKKSHNDAKYTCMPFLAAAFAHGSNQPELMNNGVHKMHLNNANFDGVLGQNWEKIGLCKNLDFDNLQPGDVIIKWSATNDSGHAWMYGGEDKVIEAVPSGIHVVFGAEKKFNRYGSSEGTVSKNYVMRFTGQGNGKILKVREINQKDNTSADRLQN